MAKHFRTVAVIVLNWNKSLLTIRAVNSLINSTWLGRLEILVIDNGSLPSESSILFDNLPQNVRKIINAENLGYAGGNQVGVNWALKHGADAIWILNNDAYVRSDTLEFLIQGAKRWPGEAVFSHTTLMSENPDRIHYSGSYGPEEEADPAFPYDRRKGLLLEECRQELQDKPANIFGHSLFIPASIIRKYGFMDPRFFLYFEETEYLWRLRKQGVETVYLAEPICVHESTASQNDDTGKSRPEMERVLKYYFERNKWYWLLKQGKIKKRAVVHAAGGIIALTKYFLFNPRPSAEERAAKLYYQNLAMWHAWWGVRGRTVLPPAPIEAEKSK